MPHRIPFVFVAVLLLAPSRFASAADPPRTVAEKTEYRATSRYADVVAFCDALAEVSPLVKVSTFGTSREGRKLPLMVISDPPVGSLAEAEKTGKFVVLAFANIHAGEVDGKEALLALARDLTAKKDHPLLRDLVILLVPILNADGNERIDKAHRTDQNGPVDGVGIRENAQGFDLNRDFVKLESPEIRSLVKLITTWGPILVIDCHTTNGSKHRYPLTYDGPRYPSSDLPLSVWTENTLFPDIGRRMKAAAGIDIAPYGNFSSDRTKWETYPTSPRFSTPYLALRDQIGLLSESYSYASFKVRVQASYEFVKASFEVVTANKADIRKMLRSGPDYPARVPIRTKTEAFPSKRTLFGFEEEIRDGKRVATDRPKDYSLDYLGRVVPVEFATRPLGGYLIPAEYTVAIETLQRHGIKLDELRAPIELPVEVYEIQGVETAARAFQSHKLKKVEVKVRAEARQVPAGTIVVSTAQPLGTLAMFLLEPHAEDGLTTWNVFDKGLIQGKDFPVLRLPKATPLNVGPVKPLGED